MAAPGTTGSHETKSSMIRPFLVQPRGNDVFIIYIHKINNNKFNFNDEVKK